MSKLSRTARYYRKNKKARDKHNEYQKKYNKKPSQVKRRVFDNKKNREFGTYGNYDGKDVSHKGNRIVLESEHKKIEVVSLLPREIEELEVKKR